MELKKTIVLKIQSLLMMMYITLLFQKYWQNENLSIRVILNYLSFFPLICYCSIPPAPDKW